MADERARPARGPMSEQQEELEPGWGTIHRGRAPENVGPQYTAPGGDGSFIDDEATAIADEAGSDNLLGPEDAAMHIEDEDGRPLE
ncbi:MULTISPECIES: hypothetical protein [Saccharothrix]|uniref:hypothetical protein n=1 Tax=Saccharothrix TaxID=2071 RepID=UPI00093F6EEF|nr:hypothetical protein [Saccharothrix sp. CB00851]OKI15367.1 hypothetical protein A6A25_13665 [Saccharothrix sp. CB00851]